MLKKELTTALVVMGVITPLAAHEDQSTTPAYAAGEMIRTADLPGGYNQSASYKLDDSYDVYFTADFIYWCLKQDGVTVGKEVSPKSSGGLGLFTGSSKTVFLDTVYKPGFQVGLGFNMNRMDDWDLYSEYTWYQNNYTTSATGKVNLGLSGADYLIAKNVSLESSFYFNNLNASLQRPFYLGRKLTANFGGGLRALWISQKFISTADDLESYPPGESSALPIKGSSIVTATQKSWGLGPRLELEVNWLLGMGFRLVTDAAVSVLYTRYTELEGTERGAATYGITVDLSESASSNYNALRAVTETSLGLGWGSYFGCNNDFHFDLSANYDFNVYWNQNMSNTLLDDSSPRNTYLHGLNVAARLDF